MREDTEIKALIAEAQRQRRRRLSWWIRNSELVQVTAGRLVRRRPLRWIWQARAAWLLNTRYNRPLGHPDRVTLRWDWGYAAGLAEMLDEPDGWYLSPDDAITEDMHNWEG